MEIRPEYESRLVKGSITVARVVWLALIGSAGVYIAVALLLVDVSGRGDLPVELSYALYVVSAMSCAGSLTWWGLFASAKALTGEGGFLADLPARGLAASGAMEPSNPAEARLRVAGGRYLVASLIAWALAESTPLFGLVLFFVTGQIHHVLALSALGIAIMVLERPDPSRLLDAARRIASPEQF